MVKLIGFNGGYGSGKSTAIEILRGHVPYGLPFRLVKFAQPLYDIQEFIYDRISSVVKRDDSFKKDRKLLQWVGTDWGRGLNENLWVEIWKAEARTRLDCHAIVVCDDVRFDNEAHAIHGMGGVVIKIVRPDASQHAEGGTGITNHASEAGIRSDLVDHTITNAGTLEEFKNSLSTLFQALAKQGE